MFPTDEHADRPNKYKKYLSSFKIDGLTFPLDPKQIPKFEELNPHITVHVQCYNVDNEIVPLVTSKNIRQKNKIINLFLLSEEKTEITDGKPTIVRKDHYTWVKDLGKLYYAQTRHNGKIYVCANCLHRYYKEHALKNHQADCMMHKPVKITFLVIK